MKATGPAVSPSDMGGISGTAAAAASGANFRPAGVCTIQSDTTQTTTSLLGNDVSYDDVSGC